MDVKEVQNGAKGVAKSQPASPTTSRQRDAQSLTSSKIATTNAEPVTLDVARRNKSNEATELRSRANVVINAINVASEATTEIDKLVKSIDGIVSQASNETISDQRRSILEGEANELVGEIRRRAQSSSHGVRPLAGEEIRFEIEEKLGRSLEVILPSGADEAFGIGNISFNPVDSIINVRTAVAVARNRIEELRSAIDEAKVSVENTVVALDVAAQNSEASQASIRDVDEALKVAATTKIGIAANPEGALQSVGDLTSALDLLNN